MHFNNLSRIWVSSIALIVAIILVVGYARLNADPRRALQLQAESIDMGNFSAAGERFRASEPDTEIYLLSGRFRIEKDRRYVLSMMVNSAPGAPARIAVDLFAPGYDNPAQERSFTTVPGQGPERWTGTIDVGKDAPSDVNLRVFYSGQPGLELSSIRFSELPKWRIWFGHLLKVLLGVVFIGFLAIIADWSRREPSGSPATVGWGLVSIYFALAIGRFVLTLLLPYWSGDEYVYKAIALGIWSDGRSGIPTFEQIQHETNLPNMLYPYLIAPGFAFGEAFYVGIRLINALVISAAIFPVYFISRRFLERRLSILIAIASVCLPSVFISAYAATEVLYFPLFLACCLAGIRCLELRRSWWRSAFFGALVGLLLSVRLNGIILVPSLLFVWLLVDLREGQIKQFFRNPTWLATPLACIVTYQILKWGLSTQDVAGLGIYENHSGGWLRSAWNVALSDPAGVFRLVMGHLTILAIPFVLGISTAVAVLLSRGSGPQLDIRWRNTMFLTVISLMAVSMAVVFTLGVSPVDLGGLGRWHSRYYFSIFPLLITMLFIDLSTPELGQRSLIGYWVAILLLLMATATFVFLLKLHVNPWFGATVDSMEAHWYHHSRWWLALFSATVVAIALMRKRETVRTLQFMLLAGWLLVANTATWLALKNSPGAVDPKCGELAFQVMAHDPGPVAVVVSSKVTLVDNVFWLPYLPAAARLLPGEGVVDGRDFAHVRYVLADNRVTVENATLMQGMGVCKIYKVD